MGIFQIIFEVLKFIFPWTLALGLILFLIMIYSPTHENSGFRGVITYIGHITVLGLGWWIGKIAGVFLISIPMLVFYYYILFHLAMVVVPVSDPYDWHERWQRFWIFVWYQWGVQYPLWAVTNSEGQDIETRIHGNPFGSFAPGLVWARSHQVVALTTGIAFSGVRQPGIVFTKAYERPFCVVDLRTQLRTSWIEAVSSDGIPYKAILFTSFAVDKEKWDPSLYHRLLRENPLLKNARDPDYTSGCYAFSHVRLHALFRTIGVSSREHSVEAKTIEWDEWVLHQVEKTAREVLSQRRLDELWQSPNDYAGVNAMDTIANAIKDKCSFQLRQRGIHLYASRIVNFEFLKKESLEEKYDEIKQKQITTWSADWQREAEQMRAEGKAEADLLKQEARAYAYTNLLTAVAEGLQEARFVDPNLPHYVIAVRFISALEKLIDEQPKGDGLNEAHASLSQVKKMLPWAMDRE